MTRLVIVSNRVADLTKATQSGGLAVGLADALRKRGGVWFGWNGEQHDTLPESAHAKRVGNVQMLSAPLTPEDYAQYYVGFANSVLWPLFHYRLDHVEYEPEFFDGYCRVNNYFADLLVPHLEPDDLVWVHDYHLIPMADCLRRRGCGQRLGFFLHIPFPPHDLLSASPNHERLVEMLLHYDVIGFQTAADVSNFRHYVEDWNVATIADDGTLQFDGRSIVLKAYPIGIDVETFRTMSAAAPEDVRIDTDRRELLRRKQIIGVDRLDYSKGLPERFRAFERLLAHHPELERVVSFLQIAPSTREDVDAYADLRAELEGLAGSINGRHSDFNWTPLRYINRPVSREKLAALFRASHVGLVTPLRDGMNLVAKEFVAAQDAEDPGVLVLSQFAGAAEDLAEALIINPYDEDGMADAIHAALHMPRDERRERHAALLKRIREHDAAAWLASFMADLDSAGRCPPGRHPETVSTAGFNDLTNPAFTETSP
ncbi:MAG: trehalose-6-phosphate synthase [Rhizobiaceae bacterium]|nr:trehalose-6-phosphate synthase [Rhizobiaceae bacterium]